MKKLFALLLTVVMMASMMVPAMAEDVTIGGYDAITPANTTIPHSLHLTDENVTGLDYTITYSFNTVTGPHIVLAGATDEDVEYATLAVEGQPKILPISYLPSDTFNADNNWTVEKTLTVDWSGVKIKEPGVYRWDVTQTYNKADLPQSATGDERMIYLFLYVVDDGKGGLKETFRMSTGINTDGTADADAKPGKLPEEYPAKTIDLTLSKSVAGTQGSQEQYFPFTITLTLPFKLDHNIEFTIADTRPDSYDEEVPKTAYHDAADNPSSVVIPAEAGTMTFTIWLKSNQSVTIHDLLFDTAYTITEGGNDGYTVTSTVDTTDTLGITQGGNTAADTAMTADELVHFTNSKEVINPTGINLQSGAAFFGIILAMGMMVLLFVGKRKEQTF